MRMFGARDIDDMRAYASNSTTPELRIALAKARQNHDLELVRILLTELVAKRRERER